MTKKLLVTGGRGFIGRNILTALSQQGLFDEIHATRSPAGRDVPAIPGIIWHETNLLREGSAENLIGRIRPSHLIHAAWVTEHTVFWNSPDNAAWLTASLALADAFERARGERFVGIGTCAEYDWSENRLSEGRTAEAPQTAYGKAKLAFHQALMKRAEAGFYTATTGRVFLLYGPHEKPGRLVPTACQALLSGRPMAFGSGQQWRDFLHVADLGAAIAALSVSELTGAVNLASGEPVRLSALLDRLATLSGRMGVLNIGARRDPADEPPVLFADTARIRSTGWQPRIALEDGLAGTLAWWRAQARSAA